MLALEYIKAHATLLDIDYAVFDNYNIHIHVPEGAVPKDGPRQVSPWPPHWPRHSHVER